MKPAHMMLKLPSWRRRMLLTLVLLGFGVLLGRSVYLQAVRTDFLQQKGDARYSRTLTHDAQRGAIVDRNGTTLAKSEPVESIWANPPAVVMDPAKAKKLAELLQIPVADLNKKISNTDREFVYLKRRLPPELAKKVMQLGVPGIFMEREYKRFYPASEYAAHLVGFSGSDGRGQEGAELAYDKWLTGKPGIERVVKDRQGRIIETLEMVQDIQQGSDLTLSMDINIQYLAYRDLAQAVERQKARAGSIVVLDSRTGEVLAMASVPSYNPNNPANIAGRARNRAIVDTYEPGSTMKPFSISAALETGKFTPDTKIDVGHGEMNIGKNTIHDKHAKGVLTVAQVLQKSSNIGTAKMGLTLSPQDLWGLFNQFGFGVPVHSRFPGEVSGRLRPWKGWRPIEQATMCFGQGVSVTLLQMARAYSVFANDGELKPISLLKLKEPAVGQQVISARTARQMREMLELVVQPGGTAPMAQVAGYRVAGKTGTAQKVEHGVYVPDRYIASFIGMAPATNPRLIIAVMIDEPSAGQYYGGAVAAPVFSSVMAGALRLLAVPHDAPTDNVVIPPADAPEVKETV